MVSNLLSFFSFVISVKSNVPDPVGTTSSVLRSVIELCEVPVLDQYCQTLNNSADSFCKVYQDPPVCAGGNQPCVCPSTTTTTTTTTTVVPTSTPAVVTPKCSLSDQDKYCQLVTGLSNSYCKTYQWPSVCLFGNQPCGCDDFLPIVTTTSPSPSVSSSASAPTTTLTPSPSATGGDCTKIETDEYCRYVNNDASSYCKVWQNPPVCQGGNQLCSCGVTKCSRYGQDLLCMKLNNDQSSYCKYWQNPAVCFGGNQPCGDCEENDVVFSTTPLPKY